MTGTAIDISNYTGELDGQQLRWIKANSDLVIVRLSTEDNHRQRDIAAQQVRALAAAGIPWQGYLWAYWDMDPYDHWRLATEKLPPGWPGYYKLGIWLDLEDPANPPLLAAGWVLAYWNLLREQEFVPGIYTGEWWVQQHVGAFPSGLNDFWAAMPLWFARYNVVPSCEPDGMEPWAHAAMHQYLSVAAGPSLMSYDLSLICDVP